jgi:hypothetical protein
MKSTVFLAAVLFAIPATLQAQSKPPVPSVHFADTIFDFGSVMAGDVVRHEFVFTNAGDANLELTGVYPSCGCTTVETWSHSVQPGGNGIVSLKFDSSRFNGPVTETTTVVNNDRSHHSLVLSFKGVVSKPVEFSPPLVILKPLIDGDASETNVVKIKNHLPEHLTLGKPVSDNPSFKAEIKTIVPEREFQLTVHSVPPVHTPMLQGTISIQTSSSRVPTITVPVLIMTTAQLTLNPSVIQFPSGPLPQETNITVILHNNGKKPLALKGAKIDLSGVDVQMKEIKPGVEFDFVIAFPSGLELPRNKEAALIITPVDPEIPIISVPLRSLQPAGGVIPSPSKPPKVLAAPDNPRS